LLIYPYNREPASAHAFCRPRRIFVILFSSLWESTFLVFLTILVLGQINMNFTMLKIMLIVSVIYMLVISVMYKLVTITPTSTLTTC
jgi:hypothetical protein